MEISNVKEVAKIITDGYLESKTIEAREKRLNQKREDQIRSEELSLEKYKTKMRRPLEVQVAELEHEHKKEVEEMRMKHERVLEELKAESNKPTDLKLAEVKANTRKEVVKTITGGITILGVGILLYKCFKLRIRD